MKHRNKPLPTISSKYHVNACKVCVPIGRFVIGLSWKTDDVVFPNNYQMAKRRFDYLKNRYFKDEEYFLKYGKKMNEYLKNGYARVVPEDYNPPHLQRDWYIPHHSTGNKFRVVFDCFARCGGTSLNENLLQGPDFTTI